ncbi:Hypothetical_protein [Hexamita inflata]|uniref:Hypothetical_protein n=1 Tax=Hexamita inflata TaxID=28002 RepID=A0AA86U8Z5_9EUKA|nr:Hypothetical protein HINF_LOCUS33584 [Hexamita inflata]CAI9945940.1 Hypothetical protein HINF_LOCUS33585 [Hexamita inflata]
MLFDISFMLTCTTNSSICEDPTLCGNQVATNVTVSCTGDLISDLQCTDLMFRGYKVSMCPYYALQSECDNACGHSCKQESDTVNYQYTQGTRYTNSSLQGILFWVCRPIPSEDLGNSTCITNLSGSVVTVNCPVRSMCIYVFKPQYSVSVNVCAIYEYKELALCNSQCSQPCEYAGDKISIDFTIASGKQENQSSETYYDAFYCRVIDVVSNQSNAITIVACCVGGAILLGVVIFVVAWFTCCKTKNFARNSAKSDNILSGQSKSMQGVDYM